MLHYRKLPVFLLGTFSSLLGVSSEALAAHLVGIDRFGLRTKMPNEGYLAYLPNPLSNAYGEEYSGWIDVRHPAMDGTQDTMLGFDRSDHFVKLKTITVTANNAMGVATPAVPDILRDFDFSNKIYAQAGLSLIRSERDDLTLAPLDASRVYTWPLDQGGGDDEMKSLKRSNSDQTINAYYIQKYDGSMPNGLTSTPSVYGGKMPRNDGSGIADQAVKSTFAHEIGHMLLNGNALHMECAALPADAGPSESCDPANFMYKTGSDPNFSDIGRTKGKIEAIQIDRIFANGGANNPGFVQKPDNSHAAGDRVDWDFVADQLNLEGRANGADNHNNGAGNHQEDLFWKIGTTVEPVHISTNTDGTFFDKHVHTGLGQFPTTPDFAGQSFRSVDVFSLITRYSDFEVDAAGNPLLRERALDYNLFFRGANGQTVPGTLIDVFTEGWTTNTQADNYLGRWLSPIDAVGIFIKAAGLPTHEGTAQIDAVIASDAKVKDFGDAPDSYKTLLASNGPRYDEGFSQRLGFQWDSEIDGQPTLLADGDDRSILGGFPVALDDEDGVIFGDSWVDVIFNIARPDPNPYQLRVWWDIDRSRTFEHPSEDLPPGVTGAELLINDLLTLDPKMPPTDPDVEFLREGLFKKRYKLGFDPTKYYSRFRLTWDPLYNKLLDPDVKPFGEYYSKADCDATRAAAGNCVSHGEVEDYAPIPEPSSIFGLLAFGGLGLMGLRKKR